ncbi:cytochrome-c peroxidase [Thermaurantimonas aggregans]|uniref:Cytochrome-c peroxidase n=1 Tax=Thermaurantimonas aggregans TaxID=2173829 RepID=A0A401XNF9_9FLAO|nr:cytochrome c peroxidase [Thermaurantimonas aggregans]MCX8149807.1 c-type cytochrome [Thermaurantimonas aggregans]GCD78558.1 cytochrome-c peroxidase [Thermaurantimonas aggregans]
MKEKLILAISIIAFVACRKEEEATDGLNEMTLEIPSYFPKPNYNFEQNKLTREGFELGRKLFYDPILSADSSISCGSCHAQVHAFADHNVAVSTGVFGRIGTRNALPTFNLIFAPLFHWDGGINHIEMQPTAPMLNHDEMDITIAEALRRLRNHPEYPELFKKVFGTSEISARDFLYALTQFQGAIISANSKYDRYRQGRAQLTADEMAGLQLFEKHCATCHAGALQTDYAFRSNGLESNGKEEGRYHITLDSADFQKFRTPSLRNVALTRPYMHDGRFNSLQAVLDHYADLGKNKPAPPYTDPMLKNGLPLSESDKEKIIAFLHTLSDFSLLANSMYSEPKTK